eukprot:8087225-Alexandrium_andersonii.AAC.1
MDYMKAHTEENAEDDELFSDILGLLNLDLGSLLMWVLEVMMNTGCMLLWIITMLWVTGRVLVSNIR